MANSISVLRSRYFQTLLATTALVSAGAVQAQEATAAGSEDDTIEEIVVRGTARRFRPADQTSATGLRLALIDTPQSVTVLTPEMFDIINADSVYEATDHRT